MPKKVVPTLPDPTKPPKPKAAEKKVEQTPPEILPDGAGKGRGEDGGGPPPPSEGLSIPKILFSFPTIFALTGTSTLVFFEQTWARSLEITLPHGTAVSASASSFLPQILTYLLLIAAVFLTVMAVIIALSLGWLAILSALNAIWRSRFYVLLELRKIYGLMHFVKKDRDNEGGAEPSPAHQRFIAHDAAVTKLKSRQSDDREKAAARREAAFAYREALLMTSCDVLFGTNDVKLSGVLARVIVLSAAVVMLVSLTSLRGKHHLQQLDGERTPAGHYVASKNADTGKIENTIPVTCDTMSIRDSFIIPIPGFLRSHLLCGRVTFAGSYPVDASRIADAAAPPNSRVSDEVFHLGHYGDWLVFAPLDQPDERVFLQARQVLEFSQLGPQLDKPITDPPSSSDQEARVVASVLGILKEMSPWNEDISVAAQTQTNATEALARVVEAHAAQLGSEAAANLGDIRAKLDGITAKLEDHTAAIDLMRAAEIDAEVSLRGDQFSQVIAALEAFSPSLSLRQDTPLDLQLTTDSMSFITVAVDSITLGGPATGTRKSTLFDKLSSVTTSDQRNLCNDTNGLVARIPFREGQVDVDPASVGPIITALEDQFNWRRDGSGDLLRVALSGYASATGKTARNNELAEQRADNVKQALVEKLFGLTAPQNGNADGPALLSAARLIVLADGMGQSLDGIDQVGPRRVDVSICRLSANSTVADATPQDDTLLPTSEQN